MQLPIKNGRVSQIYKNPGKYVKGYHTGIDFVASDSDKHIYAVSSGKIILSRQTSNIKGYDPSGWGNYVIIEQADGFYSIYAHLLITLVEEGQEVSAGDEIGIQGNTGNSTGPHLHFEVRKSPWQNWDEINPAEYLGIKNELGKIQKIMDIMDVDKIHITKEGKTVGGLLIDGKAFAPVRELFSDGVVNWVEKEKTVFIQDKNFLILKKINELIKGTEL